LQKRIDTDEKGGGREPDKTTGLIFTLVARWTTRRRAFTKQCCIFCKYQSKQWRRSFLTSVKTPKSKLITIATCQHW